jgi:phage tail-like protein
MTAEVVSQPFTNGVSSNGNGYHPEDDALTATLPSAYLRYLPEIYWDDPFMGRFLRIFEDILSPIQKRVNHRAEQFDPAVSTLPMLRFMSTWVGANEMGELPEQELRGLVRRAVALNQRRGTKAGLRMALETILGKRPYITEYSPGLVLGEDAVLGLNTSLETGRPLQVHILFDCGEDEIDSSLVHAIIRRYKPAGAEYTVSFVTQA